MSQDIQLHDSGDRVRQHQLRLNDRLRGHGDPQITVDGDCGPQTILQSAYAAWFLGAGDGSVTAIQGGTIDGGVQGIIANPGSCTQAQRDLATKRHGKPYLQTIILTGEWGAAAATQPISRVGKPNKCIFHHTDGHHPELDQMPTESRAEAIAYAKAIQRDHMHRNPPLIDSGQNFLVTRSGYILEGRHGSVAAVMDGVMVESAHCIGQNTQPGIEHEHAGGEPLTPAQRQSSLFLHAFICRHTAISPQEIHGHKEFNSTDCPGVLEAGLPAFRADLARLLGG